MDFKSESDILRILDEAQGNRTDVYLTLFQEYVKASDAPWQIVKLIIENGNQVGTDDNLPSQISHDKYQETIQLYQNLLHETVRVIAQKNMSEDDFYICLYQSIFSSELFPKEDEQCAVLLEILSEKIPELPYVQMQNLLEMSDETFKKTTDELNPQLRKAIYVLNRHLRSKTEETSQLWEIANTLGDRDHQIVYWAMIISIIRTSVNHTTNQ